LSSEFPEARFAIIGRGSMETLLRERIAGLGRAGVAAIVPFTDDIPTVMNALDVLVHPALGTEALGLVLLEAMAAAKPVIATRLDGIPEAMIEGKHGLLVPPGDVPALGLAMKHLLVNRELCSRFGTAGRAHVLENFSRRLQAERVRDLYVQLCDAGPR
jgi:glycosyltransferase involved in cell wall biosynthesis